MGVPSRILFLFALLIALIALLQSNAEDSSMNESNETLAVDENTTDASTDNKGSRSTWFVLGGCFGVALGILLCCCCCCLCSKEALPGQNSREYHRNTVDIMATNMKDLSKCRMCRLFVQEGPYTTRGCYDCCCATVYCYTSPDIDDPDAGPRDPLSTGYNVTADLKTRQPSSAEDATPLVGEEVDHLPETRRGDEIQMATVTLEQPLREESAASN